MKSWGPYADYSYSHRRTFPDRRRFHHFARLENHGKRRHLPRHRRRAIGLGRVRALCPLRRIGRVGAERHRDRAAPHRRGHDPHRPADGDEGRRRAKRGRLRPVGSRGKAQRKLRCRARRNRWPDASDHRLHLVARRAGGDEGPGRETRPSGASQGESRNVRRHGAHSRRQERRAGEPHHSRRQ